MRCKSALPGSCSPSLSSFILKRREDQQREEKLCCSAGLGENLLSLWLLLIHVTVRELFDESLTE